MTPVDHGNLQFHIGPGADVAELFPLLHQKGIWEGMKAAGQEEIVTLSRSDTIDCDFGFKIHYTGPFELDVVFTNGSTGSSHPLMFGQRFSPGRVFLHAPLFQDSAGFEFAFRDPAEITDLLPV